jgi:porphobilinogen synthase
MDYSNPEEALREIALDVKEGADMIMVKPALAYLDVIYRAKRRFHMPTAAYNVSGEYSMLKAAAREGWIDEKAAVLEVLTGIRRAGADLIVTYHAKEAAEWLPG